MSRYVVTAWGGSRRASEKSWFVWRLPPHIARCMQVRKLMLKGVSVNQYDAHGITTLHHAVMSKCIRTVLTALPRRSPIGEVTCVRHRRHDMHNALHTACTLGFTAAVHAIVTYIDWLVRFCPHCFLSFCFVESKNGSCIVVCTIGHTIDKGHRPCCSCNSTALHA